MAQPFVIPPIRNAEDRYDAIAVLLAQCTEDEQATIAYQVLEGRFGSVSNDWLDAFTEAQRALDEARAQWDARHDDADQPCAYDWSRHPNDPCYGGRLSIFGRAA